MNPYDPAFRAWCRPYGYVPTVPASDYQREKFYRYWLAYCAQVPPDCKKAHAMVQLSGLLA